MWGLKLDLNSSFHSSPVALVTHKKLDGIWKQEEPKLLLVPVPFLWAKKRPARQSHFSPATEVICKGLQQLHHQPPQADLLSRDQSWKRLLTGSQLPPSFPFLWGLGKRFGQPKPAAMCPPEVLAEGLLRWPNPAPAAFQPSARGMGYKQHPRRLVWATQTSHCHVPCELVWELAPGEEFWWPQGCCLSLSLSLSMAASRSLCPCAARGATRGSAWRVRSICELGVDALSAWFETNRQFPSQPSEPNLN